MPTSQQEPPPENAGPDIPHASMVLLAKALLFICALQFFVLSYLIYDKKKSARPEPAAPSVVSVATRATTATGTPDNLSKAQPGPWGELEYTRINIVSPEDFQPAQFKDLPPTQWHFPGHDPEKLSAFFRSCNLPYEHLAELLRIQTWTLTNNTISISPSKELVLGLPPGARHKIYHVLAEFPINRAHHSPYTFRLNGMEEWFQNSGISARSQALIKRLCYPRGPALCFSDLREVLADVPDEAEQRAIVKALSRRTGLLVKLRVRPSSKIAELTKYWSAGGRTKDIGALLESLAQVPGGTTIDIAHLLPAFARSRLNTFPPVPTAANELQPDCYWTAMNFFKQPVDALYENDAIWRKELAENYTQVESPHFGDLLFLVKADGVPHHAAVFIADEIVFTKNGGNERQPWLLMRVDDMVARYPSSPPMTLVVFRRKHQP